MGRVGPGGGPRPRGVGPRCLGFGAELGARVTIEGPGITGGERGYRAES